MLVFVSESCSYSAKNTYFGGWVYTHKKIWGKNAKFLNLIKNISENAITIGILKVKSEFKNIKWLLRNWQIAEDPRKNTNKHKCL